jgi:hypothetical protein
LLSSGRPLVDGDRPFSTPHVRGTKKSSCANVLGTLSGHAG